MNRIIITGFSGFVSRHFLNYLYENKKEYQVLGADINEPKLDLEEYSDVLDITFKKCNMLDEEAVNEMVSEFAPDYILHLAAFSSVAYSWEHPAECFNNNTRIFLNLTNAVRSLKKKCRILSVGSSEEYGNVSKDQLPLKESMNLKPVSPYAVARVSQEMMSIKLHLKSLSLMLKQNLNLMFPLTTLRKVKRIKLM